MKKGAKEGRAAQVTITDEHLRKMARLQDGAFEISRLMDGFDLIYRTVRDRFSCENEHSDEEDGLHVIFEQLISRTREYAERLEREALEVWGGSARSIGSWWRRSNEAMESNL